MRRRSRFLRSSAPLARADLHVHTTFSRDRVPIGPFETGFSPTPTPVELYQRARTAGMDYVTITDHDTIDGCLELLEKMPEASERFIMGVEVTTWYPRSGAEFHLSVLGLDERQHVEIQRLKSDVLDLVAYLQAENLVYVLNHPIWDAYGRRLGMAQVFELVRMIRDHFPIVEGKNGTMLPYQNRLARFLARRLGSFVVGGSDSHSGQAGYTYTMARACTKEEFLERVRTGECAPAGGQLTRRFYNREAGPLILHNAREKGRAFGRLAGALLCGFVGFFHQHLCQLATSSYIHAQQIALPASDRLFSRLDDLDRSVDPDPDA